MHSRAPKETTAAGNLKLDQITIRETVLDVSIEGRVTVDGMETTSWALHRIDQHLESIAKSLSIIAGAQAQIAMFESEEK